MGLRTLAVAGIAALAMVGCGTGSPGAPGWHGNDVHLVDGVWIGTERACSDDADDVHCRAIVAEALRLISPIERARVVRALRADLPTTFVTNTGEARTARAGGGVTAWEVVVIDRTDGTRRAIRLACHNIEHATCDFGGSDDWLDGHVPPSYPPGTTFG